jgi:N-terminal 7TM region of histidine kinase
VEFVLNGSAAALWAAASVSLLTAVAAWTRRGGTPGSRHFAMMTVCIVTWNVMAGMEAAAVDLPVKVFCSTIGYVGICGVTPLFLGFSMAYAGKEVGTGLVRGVLTWGIPAATLVLVFSNGAHHLVWTSFDWISTTRGRILIYNHGPWYWAWVAYNAAASLVAVLCLMQAAFQCRKLYLGQMLVLITGVALPWIGVVLYLSRANPFPGLDLPTIGFAGMGLLVLIGVSRFALFDVVPVARTALVERMEDGVIVLDSHDRVVDINPAAQGLLHIPRDAISRPGVDVLAALNYLLPKAALGNGEYQADIPNPGNPLGCIECIITPLRSRGVMTGRMIILHDVTLQRIAEQERDRLIGELQAALADVKTLSGLLPICASCKKIRDDNGYWQNLERYLQEHSEAQFSHGLCDDCIEKLYPELPVNRSTDNG